MNAHIKLMTKSQKIGMNVMSMVTLTHIKQPQVLIYMYENLAKLHI